MTPRRILRRLSVAGVALVLLTPLTTAVAQAKSVVPEIKWGTCGSDPRLKPFQCASVEVPTDYDNPHGPTTKIALTRLPATDPADKIGTLFTNPGGPGGPGVLFLHQDGLRIYTPEVRARFDILGFDPRGVGQSDPATCYPTKADESKALANYPAFPVGAKEERQFIVDSAKLAVSCRTTSPDRMAHYSTANVARDMDLLRQAVGDDKLSYVGYSYGTYLAATYAKLFPNKVRALVLDGTLLPEWYSGSNGDRSPVGVRMKQGEGAYDTYEQFLAECKKAGGNCALNSLGDPKTVVEGTLERLKTHPVDLSMPDGSTLRMTYALAVAVTFSNLYDPNGYPALAQLWTELASTNRAKAATTIPQAIVEWNRRKEDYTSIGTALQPCVEANQSGRPLAYPAYAAAADKRAPHFGAYRAWIGIQCEFLGIRDHDAFLGPWRNKVKQPVLVFGTRHDPATPYEATRPYADLYPDARMVTVEGWGHTTIGKSACADRLTTEYLTELKAPADGTTCNQDRKPFDPVPTGTQAPSLLPQ
ncbi:pimeloyl-ACP methyl ester carboxylesterase [Kribbella aluminosa]|uniref:Pimeloyl-ACP methyl ester carboxylesterase n=1 Tax=Kribbella aluminosa TaxID=416017 RepID=A0ABS4UXD2_9ACTN|nr:alpha/beta hydrolase [Kribbella aluminosa]MBP2356328.1 pimeloyl-ACP methyl ester carboxylesterase [Kribbella aluminosa]